MSGPILQLEELRVAYRFRGKLAEVVRGLSLEIGQRETYGLVGESGCGKSTLSFAVMGYLGQSGSIIGGRVYFRGEELRAKSPEEMRALRGRHIGMVYQDPQAALNPALRIGRQIAEVVQTHEGLGGAESHRQALAMLEKVRMPDPEAVMRRYPHQLSGGMQQRVLIAMALITNPDLLIMDEPTTGLDVTTEAAVLDLVNELKQIYDSAILYISHNLGVIARVCDRVGVMYAGQLLEEGPIAEVFRRPRHPYTLDLLGCLPGLDSSYLGGGKLRAIEGQVPSPAALPPGCVYHPRCRFARDICLRQEPEPTESTAGHLARCFFGDEVTAPPGGETPQQAASEPDEQKGTGETLLTVEELRKYYDQGRRRYVLFGEPRSRVKALDGISFEIGEGETLSLVGESGCGKTTLSRCVIGLLVPTSGEITFRGAGAALPVARRPAQVRRAVRAVFQNPDSSLNPRHKIGETIARALRPFCRGGRHELRHRTLELLEAVRLNESYFDRYPAQLSGGEKQRAAIARAFAGSPDLIVCDEAVSSLDVSVQASILNLLVDLKREQGCAYLFISHHLGVVRYLSDRVGVMYLGRLMEIGPADLVFSPPNHPYTEALLSAIPTPQVEEQRRPIRLEGQMPGAAEPPSGCPFHTRCPRKVGPICQTTNPPWQRAGDGHHIYCHISPEELREAQTARGRGSQPL